MRTTGGSTWGIPVAVAVLAALAMAGCGKKDAAPAKPAGEAKATAPTEAKPAAASAAATAPATGAAQAEAPKAAAAEPAWPATLPANWKVLNDYEAPLEPRKTLWGGYFDDWGFRGGKCVLGAVDEGGSRRLQVQFALPMDNSQCGTFEYLAGPKGKPTPVDISTYDRMVFLAKSGDGQPHALRFEVTELDPYDAALQGYTGETPALAVGAEWQRYEVDLAKILHPMFDRRKGKQVGIRIDRKDQGDAGSGVVLMDNITFVAKATP